MNIAYVTHTRFPTEKAHGKQIAEVCSSLVELGHEVTIICPRIRNLITEPAHDYYNLPDNFGIRYLHHFNAASARWIPGAFRFIVLMYFYRFALRKFLNSQNYDLVYVRSAEVLRTLVHLKTPVAAEMHTIPRRRRKNLVSALNKCAKVICLTRPLKEELGSMGVATSNMIVEGDGVRLDRFSNLDLVENVRAELSLPRDRAIIGYVGSFVTRNTIEKGILELIHAISILKKEGAKVTGCIVGGPISWKVKYLRVARDLELTEEDIIFKDRVAADKVPSILNACDVLVYPAPKTDHPFFQRDTSPLKLFEYLAAAKPIVCADILPLRDVVDESSVYFAGAGDPESFASAIRKAINETDQDSKKRKEKQNELALWYSWKSRMSRTIKSITQ
ncbi:glycosyltransferase family 4 protein [Candidatus Peregrinibacteria bacterium]|mgnify:CR=1 FL=1|jgi:glycosyltransferase involved in cell wall biosynthesis|nr:glycosyltransferase family 4 protein [Candidatus Peregrinibacteria bacterium]MBT3598742.1 glycosyltransferase family 4 protein [Candidatus Peregrinibacteria bacterium]MBT6731248.1 glycosyltransferase family 4 protein [Candidatus Peregrinibacteria bacterium]MBT7008826.1 glycosyltransferase family 4 protein [Candidatus Peregrinibacteria bacterium]MBT7344569.1 glycosyltransferase family 4 protein [Candidatus Peregrinibacteria bacterium]